MPSSSTLASLGLVLSLYAVYVEHKIEQKDPEEDFTAFCDIEQIGASCSAVFQLPEGRMMSYFGIVPKGHTLDVPNALIGCLYYAYMLLFADSLPVQLTQVASSLALTASLFLAYQLTVLKELCILCWTTHVINALLWWKTVRLAAHKIQQAQKKQE